MQKKRPFGANKQTCIVPGLFFLARKNIGEDWALAAHLFN